MTETQETNILLDRANKWLQRLDDKEFMPDPQKATTDITDAETKRTGKFSEFLARAMTNYQATVQLFNELHGRAKRGSLTSDRGYLVAAGIQVELLDQLQRLIVNGKDYGSIDRTMLDSLEYNVTKNAREFLYYIDYGIASGIIVEGDALKRKLAESRQELVKLGDECDRLAEELVTLKGKYEECKRQLHIKPLDNRGPSLTGT